MKLDKETFVKHQFWFLLGGFALVWLIAFFSLSFGASGPIKKQKDKYDKASKDISNALTANGGPKNEKFYAPWEDYGKLFVKHKDTLWEKAWAVQAGMYDWPSDKMARLMNNLATVPDDMQARREFQEIGYPGELTDLKDRNLTGPVEFKGGFEEIMKTPYELKVVPTREECFLVQEDFWVKRDLLLVVAATNMQSAIMEVKPLDKKPEDALAAYTLRNINWEITLIIEKGKTSRDQLISTRSTVQNVHPSRRPQYLANPGTGSVTTVSLGQDGQWRDTLQLIGEPLPWGASVQFLKKPHPLQIDASSFKNKPFFAVQVFDWYSSPIKRIEQIRIPYQSSHTVTTALKANDYLAKLDAPKEETPAEGGDANAAPGGMGMMGGSMAPGGMGSAPPGGMSSMPPGGMKMGGMPGLPGATAGGGTDVTPNNSIPRDRYLQAPKEKDQEEKPVRHMPFAIQVIIDQSHVEDFQIALANSRLRLQMTQVEMRHVRGIKPEAAGASPETGGKVGEAGPGFPGGSMPPKGMGSTPPGGMGSMPPKGMMGSMPPSGMGSMPPGGSGSMPRGMGSGFPGQMGSMPPGGSGSMPRGSMPSMGMMPMMPGLPGMARSPRAPRRGNKETPEFEEEDGNLVQLTVYAITALYRNPTEKKPQTTEGAAPPAAGPTGAPAGQNAPAPQQNAPVPQNTTAPQNTPAPQNPTPGTPPANNPAAPAPTGAPDNKTAPMPK